MSTDDHDKELQALEQDAQELGEASQPVGITCIHVVDGVGLCQQCADDYDEDPTAYMEFGDHPDGVKRWQEEQARIDAERHVLNGCGGPEGCFCPDEGDSDIPF